MPRKFSSDWASRAVNDAFIKCARASRKSATAQMIQDEAKNYGATLQSGGHGGVDPEIALKVFQRDNWRCANENCPTPRKDLTLDHIAGHAHEIEKDPIARKQSDLRMGIEEGHVDKVDALHVLCAACHDRVHLREREVVQGKKPEPMRGE